jgi:hypothetical protein
MGGEDSDKQRQEFLDKHYPFIEQGAEPPGRCWRTRHGEAIVAWSHGKPEEVHMALYPDGARGDVRGTLDYGYRRRSSGPKRWVYGTIDVRPDDVIFTDAAEQPTYAPPPLTDVPNLEAELARDEAFLKCLEDDRFAHAVYAVFSGRDFWKGADERRWSCGEKQAAYLVRDLRGLGESYHDYFLLEVDGIWPDDRPAWEAQLRKRIEDLSKPTNVLNYMSWAQLEEYVQKRIELHPELPRPTPEHMENIRVEMEIRKAEITRDLPVMEAQRNERLEQARRDLAEIQRGENGDVFGALRAHLTRLGWRTENAEDRARTAHKIFEARVQILHDIKRLELRAESEMPEWARALGKTSGSVGTGWTTWTAVSADDTEEQRQARDVGPRLEKLARSGKITKEEYDLLRERLQSPLR